MGSQNSNLPRPATSIDTIAAIATPAGIGGIGIIRISGSKSASILRSMTARDLTPRQAMFCKFYDNSGRVIDEGIALYFPKPNSYTGEDVCEIQCHGGPVLLDLLLQSVIEQGARTADPGEYTRRAYLNGKLDLAQAEAIADLINSSTASAALSAMRSLQGEFSERIHHIMNLLTKLRMYVEAAIDFPEEEIDFLQNQELANSLKSIRKKLNKLSDQATRGSLLREGLHVVIAGLPNAGKSSLLNRFAGQERVIVTPIAGTTRDSIDITINLDGLPVHFTDTAGLGETSNVVEAEGVRRAWYAIGKANLILYTIDDSKGTTEEDRQFMDRLEHSKLVEVRNKADLTGMNSENNSSDQACGKLYVSAKHGTGMNQLIQQIQRIAGISTEEEGLFLARRRHIESIRKSLKFVDNAQKAFVNGRAGELMAQDLRDAHDALGEVVGLVSPDELLGEIFSNFCIGK